MGIRWRRINERLKQRLQITKSSFLATSNRRCEMMFEEASQFAVYLRRMESNLKKLQDDAEDMMSDTRNIMLSSLPCTFDFSTNGQAVPQQVDPQRVGQNVRLDRFTAAMQIIRQKLDDEVMEPLRGWLDAFDNAEERLKMLEDTRLELDSRRRTVNYLQERVEKQKTSLGTGNLHSPPALEVCLKQLQHKEEKKNSTLTLFQEQEAQVYKILYDLNKDTACLKDYTALAYSVITESFTAAESAFITNGTQFMSSVGDSNSPRTPTAIHSLSRRQSSGTTVFNQRHFFTEQC